MIYDAETIDRVNIEVDFTDITIDKPTFNVFNKGIPQILTPNYALINNKTYHASLYIDAKVTATAYRKNGSTQVKTAEIKHKKICQMPIMVKSNICNINNMSDEVLSNINEDPTDPGGYFIIKGIEWVIDSIENITYNQPRIYINKWLKETIRCEFISKPGDSYQNSDQIIIRLNNDGQITIEIKRNKLMERTFPFFLLFKALGWNRDIDIVNNIIFGEDGNISKYMISKLLIAFKSKYKI